MYSIKNVKYKIDNKEIIDTIIKYQNDILFYLTELTERKSGYLYYPVVNLKNKTLISTNVKNNDKKYNLIKPLNEKIMIKVISIKDIKAWEATNLLLKLFSCTLDYNEELLYNDIRVFKVHDIIAYLRKIKFDLTDTELICNVFKSVYIKDQNKTNKLFCYIERDITITMILKNINRIYKTSYKTNKSYCVQSFEITKNDIVNKIIAKKVELEGNKYNIYLEPKVHLLTSKLYKKIKDNINSYNVYFVKNVEHNYYTYFIKILHNNFTLMSGYPNFKIYIKNNKKHKETK